MCAVTMPFVYIAIHCWLYSTGHVVLESNTSFVNVIVCGNYLVSADL